MFNCFLFTNLQAQEKLVFSAIPDTPLTDLSTQIISEAYRRIGIEIKVEGFPGERALVQSNAGHADGELIRIEGIEKRYPNLIMIPVSFISFQGVVFSKKLDFPITGWSSLKPYTIGIIIGSKFSEIGTTGMRTRRVTRFIQLVKMLNSGRIDVFVESRLNGLRAFQQANIKSFKILEPPLTDLPLFHYLHKKHQNLVPRITNLIIKMKDEGRFKRIRKEFEMTYIK